MSTIIEKNNRRKINRLFTTSDKCYRKSLRANLIDRSEYEVLCYICKKCVDGKENEPFL